MTTNIKPPRNFLIIEDNPGDVRLLEEALKELSYDNTLVSLSNGEDAITFLNALDASSVTPDIILLDLNMPKKGGLEVLQAIQTNQMTKEIPIIVLTGSKNDEDIVQAHNLNARCFMQKPVTPQKLEELIIAGGTTTKFYN